MMNLYTIAFFHFSMLSKLWWRPRA